MTDFELSDEAKKQIGLVEHAAGRAEGIRNEIARYAAGAREEFTREREEIERDRQILDALIESRVEGYKLIASAWADYELARADASAHFLRTKTRPAPAAAKALQEKGRELAEARRELKLARYIVELYEWHFPWLTELRDVGEGQAYTEEGGERKPEDKDDPARNWLSADEWKALPEVERNQKALDRYLKSRKSAWQLGRDYERYIGYLREQDGCSVTYHGIFKGLEDLGRDVLAEKDGVIEVIQCKRWAQHKTIHEKHIFQLYGTMVLAKLEQSDKEITGTFTTTTNLSSKAREVAEFLDIKVEEGIPLDDYPRIKCNVSRRVEGERIYHLPFDQQYDTTVIEPTRGERYVETTAEAEKQGFRRAWRWRGEGTDRRRADAPPRASPA